MDRGFSLSHRGLESSFVLEAFYDFLEGKSGLLKVNFKFNGILIRYLNSLLKPVLSFFLELSNVGCRIDVNTAEIVFLIGLFLIEFEGESGFSIDVEVGYIEIELAASERHDVCAI